MHVVLSLADQPVRQGLICVGAGGLQPLDQGRLLPGKGRQQAGWRLWLAVGDEKSGKSRQGSLDS